MAEQSKSAADGNFATDRGEDSGTGHDGQTDPGADAARSGESEADQGSQSSRPGEGDLPLDQTFEILKNQRRRYVLQYLYSTEEQVSLSDLAEQIAAWENDKEVRQISSSERKRVYVGLYQCHLPKMDSMGVVSFNKPRGIIERGPNVHCFKPYLEVDEETREPAYNSYYVGLSVLGISLIPVAVRLQTDSTALLLGAVLAVFLLTVGTARYLTERSDESDSGEVGAP